MSGITNDQSLTVAALNRDSTFSELLSEAGERGGFP